MGKQIDEIKKLIEQASKADNALDAMQFSQAANNASNALVTIMHIERDTK